MSIDVNGDGQILRLGCLLERWSEAARWHGLDAWTKRLNEAESEHNEAKSLHRRGFRPVAFVLRRELAMRQARRIVREAWEELDELDRLVEKRAPELRTLVRSPRSCDGWADHVHELAGGCDAAYCRLLVLVEEMAKPAGPQAAPAVPESRAETSARPIGEPPAATDQETLALSLLLTIGPNAAEIARRVGVPRTTMYRWPKFRAALDRAKSDAAVRRGNLPRGSKSADGDLDAWDAE